MEEFIRHYDFKQDSQLTVEVALYDHLSAEDAPQHELKLTQEFIKNCLRINPHFSLAINIRWINVDDESDDLLSLFLNHRFIKYELNESVVIGGTIYYKDTSHETSDWYKELFRKAQEIVWTPELEAKIAPLLDRLEDRSSEDELAALTKALHHVAVAEYWKIITSRWTSGW